MNESKLSNGAKWYRLFISMHPEHARISRLVELTGISERSLRHYKKEVEENGNILPPTATYSGIRQHIAETATPCRPRQHIAETQNGNILPPTATPCRNIKGGKEGGHSLNGSASPKKKKLGGKPRFNDPLPDDWPDTLRAEWVDFLKMREEKRVPVTPTAGRRLIKKLSRWTYAEAERSLASSTENTYTGVFEVTEVGGNAPRLSETQKAFAAMKEKLDAEQNNCDEGPRDAEWGLP